MKIRIANLGLVQVHNAAHNALRSSNGIQGRTRMTLDGIIDAIQSKRESFQRHLPNEVEQHVVHVNGDPQTNGTGEYVFKSDGHEQQYMDFIEMEHEIEIDPLSKQQLGNVITTQDQFGSADDHFRALKLVTKGYAREPEESNTKTQKEDTNASK